MKYSDIVWNENGWTTIQEADAKKHILGIMCNAEDGTVKEVRVRHNDGEEYQGSVLCNGKKVLPIRLDEFKKLYKAGSLEIK